MGLSNPKQYRLIFLALFISICLLANLAELTGEENFSDLSKNQVEKNTEEIIKAEGIAKGSETENEELLTQLFQIRKIDINAAKKKIEELLTKDKQIGANVEAFTLLRSGEEASFLLVSDTPLKIQLISAALEELEKELTSLTVNLDFTDTPLNRVLSTIAQTANLNIVGGEELSQRINIHLKDVPLEDVFDTILKSAGYTYIKEGKILRIIPQAEAPLPTEVFELQFASAKQIKEAVSHLVSEEGRVKSFSKFYEGKYSSLLIVTDRPQSLEAIRDLVKKLDKKLRQVMIEAKFCEVTLDKDNELGIEWVIEPYLSGATTQTRFPLPMMGTKQLDRPDVLTQEAGEITLGTISFADFTATLHALDLESKVNLIASPRIATRDGEEAEIVIGDKVPLPLYERNTSTGTMEVTGYQTEEIGVLLKVTPIINRDNTITLRIHPEVSEIAGYTGPNNERPVISTRQITTVFTVEDGKTIVLGGLMKQTLRNTLRQIPVLGSIPGLGNLFKYQEDSEDRTELLIFITPHILEEPARKTELIWR